MTLYWAEKRGKSELGLVNVLRLSQHVQVIRRGDERRFCAKERVRSVRPKSTTGGLNPDGNTQLELVTY